MQQAQVHETKRASFQAPNPQSAYRMVETYVNMSYASSSTTKSYAAYIPVQHHPPHHDTDMLAPYPLSLHPRATIETYRSRDPQPLIAPCRQCAKPTPISPTQQKLFQTIERLLQKPRTAKVSDKGRNDKNNWAVNCSAGVLAPGAAVEGKGQAWPFVDEFELDVVTKLLRRVGEGLNERCLDMYLLMLKSMDGSSREAIPVVRPPVFGTPRKPKSYRSGRYVPPTPSEPSPFRSSVSSILGNKPPLHSFKTLKDLFEIFDRIKRGSYAAARLMEAYADVVVNEACIDCWAKHNIIDMGEEEEGDMGFVGLFQSLEEKGELTDTQGFGAPVGGDVNASQTLHALPKPQNSHTLPGSRVPFSEVRSNAQGGKPGKRGREEEDELEKRWRERAKKREAARRKPNVPGKWDETRVSQPLGPKTGGGPGQSIESEKKGRSREDTHAWVCQSGKVAGLDVFAKRMGEETKAMLRERGEAKPTALSDRRTKETGAMLSQANAFIKKSVGSGTKVTPKKLNGEKINHMVSQPVRGGAKILGPRNSTKWVKQENRTAKGRAKIGWSSKLKQWSVEEINGKEVIVID